VLVTGATGFIGRRLTQRLIELGVELRALALPSDAIPIEWGEKVQVCRGDVADRSTVIPAMRDAGTVFHLAAVVGDWGSLAKYERVTVRGTEHVLGEAAREGARVLLASSVVVYGDAIGRVVCEEDRPFGRALGPYSRCKQEQERIAARLEANESLRVTIVRPTNVFGPGSKAWVDLVVDQLLEGAPTLVGDGEQVAGLTYVDNVVDLMVAAAGNAAAVGRTYNANDDHRVSWKRYFGELATLVGAPPPKAVPARLAKLAAIGYEGGYRLFRRHDRPPITREALNLIGSEHRVPIARARRDLGYAPRVSFDEGMKRVAHYLEQRRYTPPQENDDMPRVGT
jgi:nucleoside-diphosphate-sugar epimerase